MRLISSNGQHSIVVDHYGGRVLSWQHNDEHILFPEQVVAVETTTHGIQYKVRGGLFIPFPHFGSTISSGGIYMPQHGWMRTINFKVTDYTAKTMILSGHLNQEVYGYSVYVSLVFQMSDTGFQVMIVIKNRDKKPAPLNAAFHPYLANTRDWEEVELTRNGKIRIPVNLKNSSDPECKTGLKEYLTVDSKITEANAKNIIIIRNLRKEDIRLSVRGFHNEIITSKADHSEKYLLWSDKREKYICVEPYLNESKFFGTEKCIWLQPEDEIELSCYLELVPRA